MTDLVVEIANVGFAFCEVAACTFRKEETSDLFFGTSLPAGRTGMFVRHDPEAKTIYNQHNNQFLKEYFRLFPYAFDVRD